MTANAEQKSSALDYVILVLALAALVGGVYGYYYFEEQSSLYAVSAVVAAIVVALALTYVTEVGKVAWGYLRASRTEVRKVVWPTRQESLQTLLLVSVFTGVLSLFLLLCDWVAGKGVEVLLT